MIALPRKLRSEQLLPKVYEAGWQTQLRGRHRQWRSQKKVMLEPPRVGRQGANRHSRCKPSHTTKSHQKLELATGRFAPEPDDGTKRTSRATLMMSDHHRAFSPSYRHSLNKTERSVGGWSTRRIVDLNLGMRLFGKRQSPMNSIPTSKANDPRDAPAPRAEERLAHAYGQITRAGEELARVSEQVAKMEHDAVRPPSAGPRPQSPPRRPALRALVGLVLAACIVVATLVLQSSYGAGAKLVIARWAPQLVSTLPSEDPPVPAQPAPSTVQVAAAETTPLQATPLPQTAPQDAALTTTAALPDHTELLQTMARDLANLARNIEQLKANQQQIVRDSSKAIEEIKANQEEMKRVLAKVSEQNPTKTSSPLAQPAPTSRKPERTLQSPHARARPRLPREWIYDEDW
jgi:hypothetical protein